MKRIGKYIIFALIGVLFIGTFVFLFKNSRPEQVLYQEHEATVGSILRTTVITGKIEPRNEVNIKPQINGIISELRKEAGQMVKEGEVIAKLRVIPDMNSLSSAQSRVRLAEINLKQAKTNYDREKALWASILSATKSSSRSARLTTRRKRRRTPPRSRSRSYATACPRPTPPAAPPSCVLPSPA